VCVSEDRRVPRILRLQPRERIEVRLIADVQPVLFEGSPGLDRLEELSRRAGEDRDPVGRRLEFGLQVLGNPLEVAIETLALG